MKPYTERLLAHFGGGYIHYCGDNRHLLRLAPTFDKSLALNFGNPERHDPASVLADLAKVRQCYYGSFPQMDDLDLDRLSRQEDGRYNLFLRTACTCADQERFIDAFQETIR